ncbi:hypothetical protein EUX98_g4849 [Antrodiella citrinella]|uniref:Uncharacterized protein n=1 Tax=Antrodiella citrinella TaxID=2447956 RepID=A0A4V3XII5_9APHY|nr:hypothetical protein EUX98_g4849 [Antrodiella citrinella]
MTYDKISKISLQSEFTFTHIDLTDCTYAVFRETECYDDVKPLLSRTLASMFEYGNPVHRPRIVIQIRHHANDTCIPDLEPNWPALEIKCNWKGMVSEWFKEEWEYARRVKEALDGTADRMNLKALRARADRGEVTEGTSFFSVLQSFFGDYYDTWPMLRAERIARNMHKQWEDEGFTPASKWTDPDRAGYNVRSALGWDDPCSDEEEE